jgi:putative ABC transport system ATP-binding protein
MLKLENISKYYHSWTENEVQVLSGVSLSIQAWEFVAIIGPSGSGKSTLMNIIWLLDTEFEGEYLLHGKSTKNQSDNELASLRGKEIGFIFQNYSLIPRLSALDQVQIPLWYQWIKGKESYDIALKYLKKVGLWEKIHNKPNELSGWQNQRVAIARALATHPSIILADEPTWALDSKTGSEILDIFKSINEEGKTVIVITHDPKVASKAKRIIEIADGKIVAS